VVSVNKNQALNLSWSSTNAASCSILGANLPSGALNGQLSSGSYTVTAATQSDTYVITCNGASDSVAVTVTNQGPNIPTIDGPTTGMVGTSYTFGFTATDPDGDQIAYEVDWNNDGVVDSRVPSSGLVNSNTRLTNPYTWGAAGTYTFQARTVDSGTLRSGWAAYGVTVIIALPGDVTGLTVSPQSCDSGQINVTWNFVPGALGYDLQVDGGGWMSLGNVTTYNHSSLVAASNHTYRVRAWNVSGAGTESGIVNGTAPAVCTATPPTTPTTATANISGGGCSIQVGASRCDAAVTWDSEGTTGAISVRQDGAEFASNADQVTALPVPVDFGSNFFTFHHNSGVQVGVSHEIIATCVATASWNGSICAASTAPINPGLSLAVSPTTVRANQTTTLTWSIATPPEPGTVSCTILGPKIATVTFDPADPATPNNIVTGPITAKSEYFFRCTSGSVTWTDSAVVEVVGVIEET
jgi:hypothetical protein